MTKPWDLQLAVDAIGHDDAQVRVVPGLAGRPPHLKVRTGSLVVHCLDGASVTSAASAWADAQVRIGEWLPIQPPPRERPAPGFGAAYPAGSVVFEGRQPWSVNSSIGVLTVTVGCVQVRVHDRTALDTHVRAWSEASAFAARLYPGRAVPYGDLLDRARISSIQRAAREAGRSAPGRGRARD